MSSLPTPPRIGPRVPLPPPPKDDDASAATADTLAPGDLLEGRYQIEEPIGEGGVGVVYRALQLKLHRRVAVKLLLEAASNEETMRPRFQQEALTLAALSHPHIVSLTDYGLVRGRPFLVMELIEGRTLREILDEEGAFAPLRALMLLRQVVLALAYAHSLGIVHRDLKPANLIVQELPAYEHVKVLDFGMVKLLPGSYLDRGEQLTRIGFTFGTPAYMSPEHALGAEVDGRSDLYSIGILLFELLTGEKPFDGEIQDILRHHLTSPVPRLEERRPELAMHEELQELIERALAKEADQRFASAIELLSEFDARIAQLSAEAADEAEYDEEAASAPALRGALERVGESLRSAAQTSRTLWREQASPALARAWRELRALEARLTPRVRSASRAAWTELRPRLTRAVAELARLTREAKQGLASAHKPPSPALPPDTSPTIPDRTVVDVPAFAPTAAEGTPAAVVPDDARADRLP